MVCKPAASTFFSTLYIGKLLLSRSTNDKSCKHSFFLFSINKNLLDSYRFLSIIIITRNKQSTCLIYIYKVLVDIFTIYSIDEIEKRFFAYVLFKFSKSFALFLSLFI